MGREKFFVSVMQKKKGDYERRGDRTVLVHVILTLVSVAQEKKKKN